MHPRQTRLEAVAQRTHPVARQLRWRRSLSDPMTRATAGLLAATVFLTGLLWAAPAGASDPRILIPTPEPLLLEARHDSSGYCEGFDVEITWTEYNQYIIQETTSPDGTTTQRITGHAQLTVTNLSTGKSVSYNVSGPGTVVIYPEGAELLFSVDAAGPNLFWTELQFSYPGVPTISYTTGHVTFTVAASGETTAYELEGRQTDVCAVLAD
jgi:hypothetical protein